jgi:hypothetical protein
MAYKYKMVQVPPAISVKEKEHKGTEAAAYMESVVSQMAEQGWEFYRVDSIGVQLEPGCLGALFGQKTAERSYYVITFRKQA